MANRPKPEPPTVLRQAFTPDEVAEMLGTCRQTIYDMIRRQELVSFKVGRATRLRRQEIERLMGGPIREVAQ